ncbi:hypothetical protein CRV11_01980 [Candidatus Pantoea edessiphila]|uniref:Uncharacterized protein n=1 Tax=Candidatus Pantoea edessiphila TaxID=2044610 RepID=A0A2P5SY69_9GAMM|nr:YhbP family protein [Candidatus Pantoea edessiphila]MBK4775631.1 hypothetical protein [Pantoea sp. Edef]PPI87278.1 hypothetical protein CRV11_01980 [Candidatus Pantoea edessiphila]
MLEFSCILDFLEKRYLLSLCCVDDDNLWCANCFYVFDATTMSLWLMTDLNTRHGLYLIKNPNIAGTIDNNKKNISLIQGIQYKGCISMLEGINKKKAFIAYHKRFPMSQFISAPIWSIKLEEIKMTDNTSKFGNKIIWHRNTF